ncbi:DMT family transporter OS=Streptomyces tendae OX=1932 GN=GUR47_02305 PE=4 SV=1 [Streptomyces tendae]
MNAALVAVLLSLVSACAYAAAAVAQERLASRASGTGPLRMLASGAWWWAVALNASAALLHVVALKYGPLTVVQPLGALTLVAAVPLGARLAGRRVSVIEWRGTGLTLLGLGALLLTASGPAPDDVLSVPEALTVSGATAALIGMLSWPGTRPGLRHATASGIASGVASALTQTVTVAVTDRSGPLLSVQVIGVAVLVAAFATGGLLLSQTAYRGGLGAPLAVVTLANPVAAAVIGLALLGERLKGGAGGVLIALTGAALAAWGVLQLSRATPDPAPDGPGPTGSVPAPAVSGSALSEPAVPRPSALPPAVSGFPVPPGPEAEGPGQAGAVLVPRQPGPGHLTRL